MSCHNHNERKVNLCGLEGRKCLPACRSRKVLIVPRMQGCGYANQKGCNLHSVAEKRCMKFTWVKLKVKAV